MLLRRPWSFLTVRQKPYWVTGLSEDVPGLSALRARTNVFVGRRPFWQNRYMRRGKS